MSCRPHFVLPLTAAHKRQRLEWCLERIQRLGNLFRPPSTLDEFQHQIQVAWDEIPQEEIDHLMNSMPRRVRECLEHHDDYFLVFF
ncbi:hypothetical protein BDFB_013840 [Asbolus verrucosus]|uniref:DDE 3 domain containing protein n=1 Tax=Asbolus verrucosus TaxID=1661398 RepID=A0A482VLZ3_ASBVE|nr:hypothetical protein BDFB_013840 [Asbolus verrucosus]